eukprot:scaffold207765_cov35-Tisochrysis_lutea.AAC.4
MEYERLCKRQHRPGQRSIGDDEKDLKKKSRGALPPEVDEAQDVRPVTEIVQEVMLLSLLERVPAKGNEYHSLRRVPKVEVFGSGAHQVAGEADVEHAQCERDLVLQLERQHQIRSLRLDQLLLSLLTPLQSTELGESGNRLRACVHSDQHRHRRERAHDDQDRVVVHHRRH